MPYNFAADSFHIPPPKKKGPSLRRNTLFEPQSVRIGAAVLPWAQYWEKGKDREVNKVTKWYNFAWREVPSSRIETKICILGNLADVISQANGCDFAGVRISHFLLIFAWALQQQGRNHGWKVEGGQGLGPNSEALAGRAGCWCGTGSPLPAVRVRGYHHRRICENLSAAFWWPLAVKFLAFWKLRPRSWGTNSLFLPVRTVVAPNDNSAAL